MNGAISPRHTGLVVKDLERSLAFYRGVLGLELAGRAREEGDYISSLVGIPGAVLEWAKLKGAGGHAVELLQYISPRLSASPEEIGRANRPGCSHLAFTVEDIEAVCAALKAAGCACDRAPLLSPDGKVKVVYAHDPDGIILEMVQELN